MLCDSQSSPALQSAECLRPDPQQGANVRWYPFKGVSDGTSLDHEVLWDPSNSLSHPLFFFCTLERDEMNVFSPLPSPLYSATGYKGSKPLKLSQDQLQHRFGAETESWLRQRQPGPQPPPALLQTSASLPLEDLAPSP